LCSWLDEIHQKQSELGTARITVEKLRQREQFLVAEIDLLKVQPPISALKTQPCLFPFPYVRLSGYVFTGWHAVG
jgi:hypothetical protein